MGHQVSDPRFRDGVAIVAGGSGGIGRAICVALAEAGSDVVLTYHRNRTAADAVVSRVAASGRRGHAAQLNLENAEAVKAVVDDAARKFGRIHSVVYAAGPEIHMKLIGELDPAEWSRACNADVNGCFNLIWAALPHLRSCPNGSIVALITAAVGRVPARDILSASPKAAVQMFLRGVAKEEGRWGVRANCVGPGWIDAGLGRQALETEFSPEHVERIRRSVPLKRFGEPEEVADAVVFLLSSKAAFITGQTIAVDGGGQL